MVASAKKKSVWEKKTVAAAKKMTFSMHVLERMSVAGRHHGSLCLTLFLPRSPKGNRSAPRVPHGYGGCLLGTQSLEDQLERADAGSWQKSPTATPRRAQLPVA